jgi:hypothetical protein
MTLAGYWPIPARGSRTYRCCGPSSRDENGKKLSADLIEAGLIRR